MRGVINEKEVKRLAKEQQETERVQKNKGKFSKTFNQNQIVRLKEREKRAYCY